MGEAKAGGELRHYLALVWRRKWLLAAIVVLIPVGVFVVSSLLPKVYEASTTLQVRSTSVSSSLFSRVSVSTSTPSEAARLIETTLVARTAARELGEPVSGARSLLDNIEVEVEGGGDVATPSAFLTITAHSSSPARAAEIADAFAAAISTQRTDETVGAIDDTIKTLTSDLGPTASRGDAVARKLAEEELAQQLQELRALRASQSGTTQVVEPAITPTQASSPNPVRNTFLGALFALLLAAGLIPILDRLDRRLRDTGELEKLTDSPLLAMVPENAFPGRVPAPNVVEAFQTLRASLTYFNVDRKLNSVIVTSPLRGDGKTTVATNLAIALAQDERNVILVDGDLRRHDAARRVGLNPSVGLDSVLLGEASLDEVLVDVPLEGGNLEVLPASIPPPNPSVLLGSKRMRSLLAELSERADIVIIDTPPLLAVSDAVPLLDQASGVVVVSRLDHTTRDALKRARQVIEAARGQVLGVVATGIRASGLYGHGYGYGYGYGYGEADGANNGSDSGMRSRVWPFRNRKRRGSEVRHGGVVAEDIARMNQGSSPDEGEVDSSRSSDPSDQSDSSAEAEAGAQADEQTK